MYLQKMKLAAIYNIWDGAELLAGSLKCIREHVDIVIIIWQRVSNWGEEYDPLPEIMQALHDSAITTYVMAEYRPDTIGGAANEIAKRNLGLDMARQLNCTHFLHMDTDEYYTDFGAAKAAYIANGEDGSVCPLYTYFKHPTWRCDKPDGYYVPFIHKLWPYTDAGGSNYGYYVDPTRRINSGAIVKLSQFMHHFSWVRRDINRKIRNSSARHNISVGTLMSDYNNPALEHSPSGYYIKDWDRRIVVVENEFNININYGM